MKTKGTLSRLVVAFFQISRGALFLALFSLWGQAPLLAAPCTVPSPVGWKGPCVECELTWSSLHDYANASAFYWDVCQGVSHESPTLHYFPTGVRIRKVEGRKALDLRKNALGEFVLTVGFEMHFGFSDVGSNKETTLTDTFENIKKQHPNVRFISPPPEEIQAAFVGEWQHLVKKTEWELPTGLDPERRMRLRIVFQREPEQQILSLLERPLGVFGKLVMRFAGFDKLAKNRTMTLSLPFAVGGVRYANP
jgi:hypothetical protein